MFAYRYGMNINRSLCSINHSHLSQQNEKRKKKHIKCMNCALTATIYRFFSHLNSIFHSRHELMSSHWKRLIPKRTYDKLCREGNPFHFHYDKFPGIEKLKKEPTVAKFFFGARTKDSFQGFKLFRQKRTQNHKNQLSESLSKWKLKSI